MSPGIGLIVFLLVTVGLLAGAVVTGLQARRRLHLPVVAAALVSLAVTIYFAEQLGRHYDLETAGWVTSVHMALAKTTTFAFLLPVITGVRALKHATARPLHRKLVIVVLSLVALTSIFGTWMVLASEPLP
jgi:hypothetical protein